MGRDNLDPLLRAQQQIKWACDKLQLEPAVYELLKNPQRVVEVSIPVKMDDGRVKVFTGYRSQHNNALGAYKGGIRFHPAVNREEVIALSIWMTFKCAITGIPYGGGKGGITVNPQELSKSELEKLSRGYVAAIHNLIGEKIDIPAPDINTNAQIMAWMVDEYTKYSDDNSIGVFTGKPLEFGGSKGRTRATGLGVVTIADEILKKNGKSINGAKVAVQGFGNVGSFTAKCAQDFGAKVVAIAELHCNLYNPDGIDIDELMEYRKSDPTLKGFPKATTISSEEFWALEVDVIFPCAMENVITTEVANTVKTKIIVEGANGPTTEEADKLLKERGVTVVPDILANAGGVTVSYFEWVQNLYGYYWSDEEVEAKEKTAMVNAFDAIYKIKELYNVSMREAAYMHSIKKIAETMKIRGWY